MAVVAAYVIQEPVGETWAIGGDKGSGYKDETKAVFVSIKSHSIPAPVESSTDFKMFTPSTIVTLCVLVTGITATLDPATSHSNATYPAAPNCARTSLANPLLNLPFL